MNKVIRIITIYIIWIVDLILAFVLMLISRTLFLRILALFYQPGNLAYGYKVGFADKVFSTIVGLIWLAYAIVSESYLRANALKENPLNLFAKLTGPVMLCLFIVDLILLWLQGIGNSGWTHWLILAVELGIGAGLLIFAKLRLTQKQN